MADRKPHPRKGDKKEAKGSHKTRKANQRNHTQKTSSALDREARLVKVAELDRQGYSQSEIAKKVGVSQPMISKDMALIRKRYEASIVHDKGSKIEWTVQCLRDVMRECWEAWQRSKEDVTETIETRELEKALSDLDSLEEDEEGGLKPKKGSRRGRKKATAADLVEKAKMIVTKIVTSRKGRLPANEYMTQVRMCLDQIASLHGLYPTEGEAKGKDANGALPGELWNVFALPAPEIGVDSVERNLERMKAEAVREDDVVDAEIVENEDPETVSGGGRN